MTTRIATLVLALALFAAACGDDDAGSATTGPAATTAPAATTTAAPATTAAGPEPAIEINDDNQVAIDWDRLDGVFFAAPVPSAADPLFHVHNQETDGFFLSIEAYTVYGTAWTGETGSFRIDCSPGGSGICVHFDPDGPGPAPNLGADFLATGTIEILRADFDGFVAVLTGVTFSDGTTIPGPLTITG